MRDLKRHQKGDYNRYIRGKPANPGEGASDLRHLPRPRGEGGGQEGREADVVLLIPAPLKG